MATNPACQTFIPRLSPYIDGELPPAERQAVDTHLSACRDCTGRVADLRAESGLVRLGMEMLADEASSPKYYTLEPVVPEHAVPDPPRDALYEVFDLSYQGTSFSS